MTTRELGKLIKALILGVFAVILGLNLNHKSSSSPTMGDNDNKNTVITGSDFTGPITQNRNCMIAAIASILNISENRNANIKMDHCKSQVISCNNLDYEGKEDEMMIKDDANLKFAGSKNKGSFLGNKNMHFKGASNEVIFQGNANVDYTGSHGKVKAESNKNLKIEGDNNMIQVEETANHHLKRHQSGWFSTPPEHTTELEIEPDSRNGVNGQPYKVFVGYPKEATIRANSYSIGAFQFLMDNRGSPSVVKLRLQGGQPFQINCDGPGKCKVLRAGEELVVKGPKITKADDKSLYIHLDGTGSML